TAPVGCERLSLVTFSYVDFEGRSHADGQIVVLDAVAPRLLQIFEALQARGFPIAKAKPVEAYEGDDDASMADNNTSGFNDRPIAGTTRPSLHAYGVAIDLDPVQNPYLTFNGATVTVAPPAGAAYLNRRGNRPGKDQHKGLAEEVVTLFAENGFAHWGGDWDDPIDYQHFDIGRPLAEALAALPPEQARARFEASIAERSAPRSP
ncbi:MAG: M15 family metallopeptidase, partial [Rhizomicrobium sp.]|nr:M15 family metallopeptidase [Rhizomicrobium sp.]